MAVIQSKVTEPMAKRAMIISNASKVEVLRVSPVGSRAAVMMRFSLYCWFVQNIYIDTGPRVMMLVAKPMYHYGGITKRPNTTR